MIPLNAATTSCSSSLFPCPPCLVHSPLVYSYFKICLNLYTLRQDLLLSIFSQSLTYCLRPCRCSGEMVSVNEGAHMCFCVVTVQNGQAGPEGGVPGGLAWVMGSPLKEAYSVLHTHPRPQGYMPGLTQCWRTC